MVRHGRSRGTSSKSVSGHQARRWEKASASVRSLRERWEAIVEFLPGQRAVFDAKRLKSVKPVLVVGRFQIFGRPHLLDRGAELIDVKMAAPESKDEHAEHAPLPIGVKNRLFGVYVDGAVAMSAATIVNAIHGNPLSSASWGGPRQSCCRG